MTSMRLPEELLEQYEKTGMTPLLDVAIRVECEVPFNRYYSISFWPPERRGVVEVDMKTIRTLPSKKISKSYQ